MKTLRLLAHTTTALTFIAGAACSKADSPASPTPPTVTTANVYILPGAINLGGNAFGDESIIIHRGERMRWVNVDTLEHTVVPDTSSLPEFASTGPLPPGGERSFVMNTVGTVTVHCKDHPQMTGKLVVQEP